MRMTVRDRNGREMLVEAGRIMLVVPDGVDACILRFGGPDSESAYVAGPASQFADVEGLERMEVRIQGSVRAVEGLANLRAVRFVEDEGDYRVVRLADGVSFTSDLTLEGLEFRIGMAAAPAV